MSELASLLVELTCGDDARAEAAAVKISAYPIQALDPFLQADDADIRWWAVRAAAGFSSADEVIGRLVTALGDESGEVRQCAALGLCHHPHPQAVSPLIKALSDPDTMTVKLAAKALVSIGFEATPQLVDVLKTGETSAKLEAAHALAEIKDPRAIPALMNALQTDSVLTQYWAEQGLDNLGLGMLYVKPA